MSDLIRTGVIDPDEVAALQAAVSVVELWPAGSHMWGHYAEQTANGPAICRTENVSACDPTVGALVDGALQSIAEDLLGQPAVAFKDKLNYKQPGGAGFSPHQDVTAYPGVARVASVLVAIDDCSLESGCIWLAAGVDSALETDDRGAVRADIVDELVFAAAELRAGDAVCIDGFAPHYSEANRSNHARRVLVASYAPAAEGYTRETYYEARQSTMTAASARDGRFRISTLADFEGDEVAPDLVARHSCTHAPVTAPGDSPSMRPATR
ncbi:MAG TPA: phytanoyl-CoA dioxygenase family protein [Acidimicrobiales bacterium]|jgi:hypothetical protein